MNEIIRDGGMKSRKLWFSLFAIVVIFTGGVLAAKYAGIASIYGTMVTGVLGVVSAYLVGNVGQKLVGVKALSITGPDDQQPKADTKPAAETPVKPPAPRFSED